MNYFVAIWYLLAITASINADGGLGLGGLVYAPGHASADYYAYPRYAFEYAVKDPHTGDNKAQWEKRDGDVVKGAYSLVEPDGSLRVVDYWADDKSGFNAVVKRIGPNLHPTAPAAPIYKASIPLLGSAAITAPISIGPIAKYSGLTSAPLITGPLGLSGAAVSTANLIKAAPISVAAPVLPIISAPILKPAPYLGPVGVSAPLLPAPLLKSSGPIISAPAPIWKAPVGIPAVSLGDGLIKGSLGGYDNLGLGLSKIGYNNIGLAKGGYADLGVGLLAKGGYDSYGLGLTKGGYDNYGLGLAKGGYDNYGLGLAKGGYDNYGLGLAKGGYDNYGLGLTKGGYDNYGLGLVKGGPILPAVVGAWGGPLEGNLGWKQ